LPPLLGSPRLPSGARGRRGRGGLPSAAAAEDGSLASATAASPPSGTALTPPTADATGGRRTGGTAAAEEEGAPRPCSAASRPFARRTRKAETESGMTARVAGDAESSRKAAAHARAASADARGARVVTGRDSDPMLSTAVSLASMRAMSSAQLLRRSSPETWTCRRPRPLAAPRAEGGAALRPDARCPEAGPPGDASRLRGSAVTREPCDARGRRGKLELSPRRVAPPGSALEWRGRALPPTYFEGTPADRSTWARAAAREAA